MTNTQNSPALPTNVVFCLWTDSGDDSHMGALQGIFFTRKGAEDFIVGNKKNEKRFDDDYCDKWDYDKPYITEEIVSP